nr:seipin [Quercus suber]
MRAQLTDGPCRKHRHFPSTTISSTRGTMHHASRPCLSKPRRGRNGMKSVGSSGWRGYGISYRRSSRDPPANRSWQDTALKPYRVVVSKPARRAYLTTILAVSTGLILFGLAVTAYVLFYWSYIPRIGFERVVHLQFEDVFDTASNTPHGTVQLSPDVVNGQPYDVVVELVFPRTPNNLDAGNFMLQASMLAPEEVSGPNTMDTVHAEMAPGWQSAKVLATSRRPAILPYRSPAVELMHKLTQLHWYVLGLRQETEKLQISMFERVEFARGWRNLPSAMRLELHSRHRLQIYSAKATFRARFRGLRWLMYNHRIASAIFWISVFWTTELLFAGFVWAMLTFSPASDAGDVKTEARKGGAGTHVKDEGREHEDEKPALSDTERTFPTLSTQTPLRYESATPPRIKQETAAAAELLMQVPEAVRRGAEADDEDEDEDVDFFLDSGLGTSMESSGPARRESMRRRRGRLARGEEK